MNSNRCSDVQNGYKTILERSSNHLVRFWKLRQPQDHSDLGGIDDCTYFPFSCKFKQNKQHPKWPSTPTKQASLLTCQKGLDSVAWSGKCSQWNSNSHLYGGIIGLPYTQLISMFHPKINSHLPTTNRRRRINRFGITCILSLKSQRCLLLSFS